MNIKEFLNIMDLCAVCGNDLCTTVSFKFKYNSADFYYNKTYPVRFARQMEFGDLPVQILIKSNSFIFDKPVIVTTYGFAHFCSGHYMFKTKDIRYEGGLTNPVIINPITFLKIESLIPCEEIIKYKEECVIVNDFQNSKTSIHKTTSKYWTKHCAPIVSIPIIPSSYWPINNTKRLNEKIDNILLLK